MANSFSASVRNWTDRAKENADLIFKASVQDTFETMTRRAAGTTDGGTVTPGYVPVVDGELINSAQIEINGGEVARGGGKAPPDVAASIVGLGLGDTIVGVFTAPHGPAKEYGYTTAKGTQVPGWFFVRGAAQDWQATVDKWAKALGE